MTSEPRFHRILLANPPSGLYRRDDRCQSRVEDQTVRVVFPPVDLALLAAVAREAGATAEILDCPATGASAEDLREAAVRFQPDLFLFNATAGTLEGDLATARLVRETLPDARIAARGDLFERSGVRILERFDALDYAFWGEIEENFRRIVRGDSPDGLAGVAWRDAVGAVRATPGTAIIEDLGALPLPARDLLDNARYRSPETGRPLTVIQASRGCPAQCVFCPAGRLSGRRLRVRPPESIVAELRECVERWGVREFLFNGDTFTMKRRWVLELCEQIVASGLDVRWGCNSRVDSMDAERAEALQRAGCWVVAFGVESGDAGVLEQMKKGATLEQAERAVAAAKAAGLATHAFFLIGTPWETRETLARTLEFARRLDTDFFDVNIAYPLPGTELYDLAAAERLIVRTREIEGLDQPLPDGSYAEAALRTRTLPAEELTRFRRRALLRLYLRPRYILRTLARARRAGALGAYLRAAGGRLRGLLARPGR